MDKNTPVVKVKAACTLDVFAAVTYRTTDTAAIFLGRTHSLDPELSRYGQRFIAHLLSPRHMAGANGPDFVPDGEGRIEGAAAGSSLTVWIRVGEAGHIDRIAWRATGMPQAVASTSAMAEMVAEAGGGRGMLLTDALLLTPEAVAEQVGGLPARKIHETVLGPRALREALGDRFRRLGLEGVTCRVPGSSPDEERLCQCVGVTAQELKEAALACASFEAIQARLGISTGCGTCEPDARALHAWFRAERTREVNSMKSPLDEG